MGIFSEVFEDEIDRLKKDQEDWRKGVTLIASALGDHEPRDLCCVRIAELALEVRAKLEAAEARVATLEAQGEREIPLDVLYDAFRSSARHGEKLRWQDLEDGAYYLCVRSNCERLSIQQFTPEDAYPWHGGNEWGCWLPYLKIGEPDLTYLDDDEDEPLTPPADREAKKEGTQRE